MLRLAGKFTTPLLAGLLLLWLFPSFFYFRREREEPDFDFERVPPSPPPPRVPLVGKPPPPAPKKEIIKPEHNPPHPPLAPEFHVELPLSRQETLEALETLLRPRSDSDVDREIAQHNRKVLGGVVECAFGRTCRGYQSKVLVLDGQHFPSALHPSPLRDNYFESSAISSLTALKVPFVFSQRNASWAVSVHALLDPLIHGIIFQEGDHVYDLKACFADDSEGINPDTEQLTPGCVQSPHNPRGLPAHKMFGWSNDEFPGSPLGRPWTLVSEPFEAGQTFIGFSLQSACESGVLPHIPHSKRSRNPARAWIHANLETYFWHNHNVWKPELFDRVMEELGIEPTAALEPGYARLKEYKGTEGVYAVPRVLKELDRSRMGREQWLSEMSQSVLLVGLGDPKELPLPYEAFCMGIPFLNPIQNRDESNPSDRSHWTVLNTLAKSLDPPYVYNVWRHDEDAFLDAFRGALNHPIDKGFIPPLMTEQAVRERWEKFLDTDWLKKARKEAPDVLEKYQPASEVEGAIP